MTRTAEGATLALLDALEPEAKAGWEAELLNIPEAIAASQAITDRNANVLQLNLAELDAQARVPGTVREAYDPTYSAEP